METNYSEKIEFLDDYNQKNGDQFINESGAESFSFYIMLGNKLRYHTIEN
jgi:hypothetical protein